MVVACGQSLASNRMRIPSISGRISFLSYSFNSTWNRVNASSVKGV